MCKGVSYLLYALEIIDVLHLGIEKDCNGGIEIKKAIHIFASLEYKIVMLAKVVRAVH